jgi:hypothetical protein
VTLMIQRNKGLQLSDLAIEDGLRVFISFDGLLGHEDLANLDASIARQC